MGGVLAPDELRAFLVEAKRGTYAAGNDAGRMPSPFAGARQLEYERGRWLYRDLYYGSTQFAGQETVYLDGAPVWSMVYAGGVLAGAAASPADVYHFLRLALLQVTPERPFRGPEQWDWQGWHYASRVDGGLDRFDGRERISHGGVMVYSLVFAGGEVLPIENA